MEPVRLPGEPQRKLLLLDTVLHTSASRGDPEGAPLLCRELCLPT